MKKNKSLMLCYNINMFHILLVITIFFIQISLHNILLSKLQHDKYYLEYFDLNFRLI